MSAPTADLLLRVVHAPERSLLGRHLPLDPIATLTLGRALTNTLVLAADGISRTHARLEPRPDGWWVLDAGSTNGTFVNGARVHEAPLRRGDCLQLGSVLVKLLHVSEARGIVETDYSPTRHDGLTGLHNRRALLEELDRALARPERPLALILLDLDRFKPLNDAYGHLVGDRVLQDVARRLRAHTPDLLLARASGDAFAVLLPADLDAAAALADRLRAAIASPPVTVDAHTIAVTASAGVAAAAPDTRGADDLVRAAHEQLFAARRR